MKEYAEMILVEFINGKEDRRFKTYELVDQLRCRGIDEYCVHSILAEKIENGDITRHKRGHYKVNRILKSNVEVIIESLAGVEAPKGI